MNDLNWETINTNPVYSKNPNKLVFFNDAGKEASETEDASTREIEFVGMEAVENQEQDALKITNPKKLPVVRFKFVDLKDGLDKEKICISNSRFFDALRKSQPNTGEKIKIMRTGSKMTVAYFVQKLQSQAASN